jgi:CheY-like chemotaxis protein
MSGMSGLELVPKAKAVRPDVPIIMITAYGDPETKRQAFENGAEALLTKPIDSRRCAVRICCAARVSDGTFQTCVAKLTMSLMGAKQTSRLRVPTSEIDPETDIQLCNAYGWL